jgi:hypothetical protein
MSFVTIECHSLSDSVSECLSCVAEQFVSHSLSLQGGVTGCVRAKLAGAMQSMALERHCHRVIRRLLQPV